MQYLWQVSQNELWFPMLLHVQPQTNSSIQQ
uniref:Uncharacterized protein n=1 Tax=Anguilla anguilla TaxID=7936 RepID=A0A0E9VB64_ANGAN